MSSNATKPKAKPSRRTQAERSEAMRVDATLQCLVTAGYAGTTVSRIVETAQVSRGAPVHHFPSKAALMEAAAEQLLRRFYISISLGKMIKVIEAGDRVHDLIMAGWRNLLTTPEATALLELLVASRHEPELAATLQKLWAVSYRTTRAAAEHYPEPAGPHDSVGDLIILPQWLLRGMAEDRHINAAAADSALFFDRYLKLCMTMLAGHLRARPGIYTPPPKPAFWDVHQST
ncbi:MAG: transcriptional regulator [Moraxellaceae bacterium]|jgi:AcrR family transcriptional regulator|nr:transcriptional regulator [Moraxellaceae bacterium]